MARIGSRTASTLSVTAFLLLAGTPTVAAAAPGPGVGSTSARQQPASGEFTAVLDPTSLQPTPVGERKCRLQVQGTLLFTGTLAGTAEGQTTALIDAPCPEVLANPPGTFSDVFRFEGVFTGDVAGVPVTDADLDYAGVTRAGGQIDANLRLRDEGAQATLRTTDAQVAVGGTYRGIAVTRG